jgi:hypothetical protein
MFAQGLDSNVHHQKRSTLETEVLFHRIDNDLSVLARAKIAIALTMLCQKGQGSTYNYER